MPGVTVRLLKLPEPINGITLRLQVGDLGYVTGAYYVLRLVSVRFDCGEIWLRAVDVARVVPVTVRVGTLKAHDSYAKGPTPWRTGGPYVWTPEWAAVAARLRADFERENPR